MADLAAMNASMAKGNAEAPKILESVINNANAQIHGLERFEKELYSLGDRLQRIATAIEPSQHFSNYEKAEDSDKPKYQGSDSDIDRVKLQGIAGRIEDMGLYANEIERTISKRLITIRDNIDFIEKHI